MITPLSPKREKHSTIIDNIQLAKKDIKDRKYLVTQKSRQLSGIANASISRCSEITSTLRKE